MFVSFDVNESDQQVKNADEEHYFIIKDDYNQIVRKSIISLFEVKEKIDRFNEKQSFEEASSVILNLFRVL